MLCTARRMNRSTPTPALPPPELEAGAASEVLVESEPRCSVLVNVWSQRLVIAGFGRYTAAMPKAENIAPGLEMRKARVLGRDSS